MAHVTCRIGDHSYELRFHVHALTLPGETQNARKFRGALYTLQPSFAKAVEDTAPALVAGAGKTPPQDVVTLLRQLAELRDGGIITDDEFAQKKAELLSRL